MQDPHDLPPPAILRDDDTLDGAAILRLLDKPLTADDLRDATARVARPLDLVESDTIRLLLFRMGDERFAVESVQVHQVTRATNVHRIPHRSNAFIRGLCDIDGELMLCGDLASLLGLPNHGRQHQTDQCRMIVLGDTATRWVVEVDVIDGVATVERSALRQSPITVDATAAHYTTALVTVVEQTAALLDVEHVTTGFQGALR